MEFLALLKDLGVPVSWALVVWLIVRGEQREKRTAERLAGLEKFFRHKLVRTVNRSTTQIARNTEALQGIEPAIQQTNTLLARIKHA